MRSLILGPERFFYFTISLTLLACVDGNFRSEVVLLDSSRLAASVDPVAAKALELLRVSLQCKKTPERIRLGVLPQVNHIEYETNEYLGDTKTFVDMYSSTNVMNAYGNPTPTTLVRTIRTEFKFSDIHDIEAREFPKIAGGFKVQFSCLVEGKCIMQRKVGYPDDDDYLVLPGESFESYNMRQEKLNAVEELAKERVKRVDHSYIDGICDAKTAGSIKIAVETLAKLNRASPGGATNDVYLKTGQR